MGLLFFLHPGQKTPAPPLAPLPLLSAEYKSLHNFADPWTPVLCSWTSGPNHQTRPELPKSGLAGEAAWLQKWFPSLLSQSFPGARPVDIIGQDWRNYPLYEQALAHNFMLRYSACPLYQYSIRMVPD